MSSALKSGDFTAYFGRTYLYAGQYKQAGDAVRHAFRLITDTTGKDYLDLEILDGDLEADQGHRRTAADRYDGALSRHHAAEPELTEMRARAHLRRGLNRAALGQNIAAIQDFRRAAEIWRLLGERAAARRKRNGKRSESGESSRPPRCGYGGGAPPCGAGCRLRSHESRLASQPAERHAHRSGGPGRGYLGATAPGSETSNSVGGAQFVKAQPQDARCFGRVLRPDAFWRWPTSHRRSRKRWSSSPRGCWTAFAAHLRTWRLSHHGSTLHMHPG